VPIPENVKDFKSIFTRFIFTIKFANIKLLCSHYGESAVAFLRKFEQNSLLANVKLGFYNCSKHMLQIMTNFLPLFTQPCFLGNFVYCIAQESFLPYVFSNLKFVFNAKLLYFLSPQNS
jgi:hypothetical protein